MGARFYKSGAAEPAPESAAESAEPAKSTAQLKKELALVSREIDELESAVSGGGRLIFFLRNNSFFFCGLLMW